MFYRVRATISFTIEDEARDFYHDCHLAISKGVTINPNQDNAEPSSIMLERCYHDEHPTKPCEAISSQILIPPP